MAGHQHAHKHRHGHGHGHEHKGQGHDRDDGAEGAEHMSEAGAKREATSQKLRIVGKWEESGKTFIRIDTTGVDVSEGMTGVVMGMHPSRFEVVRVSDNRVAVAETDGDLDEIELHVHFDQRLTRVKESKGGPVAGVVNISTMGRTTILRINKGAKAGVVAGMHGTVKKDGQAIGEIVIFNVTAKEAEGKTDVSVEEARGASVQLGHSPAQNKNQVTGNIVNREYPEEGAGMTLKIDKGSDKGIRQGMLGTLVTQSGAVLEVVMVSEVTKRECEVDADIHHDKLPVGSQVVFKLDQ